MGISGHFFGGADIPGFNGQPSTTDFILLYKLGIFYPFFRAHSEINY
jgi:alpha-glucosidase (family GH31 glycosyl hydrolase)